MNVPDPSLSSILDHQASNGAFRSTYSHNGSWAYDENGFITALVVRELMHAEISDERWLPARNLALDYLEGCRSHRIDGAFCFWPETGRPPWANKVPPDVDDTAVIADVLRACGRLDASAQWTVIRLLSKARVQRPGNGAVPWLREGAFTTWIGAPGVVDCCVNANAVAFLIGTGMVELPGVGEAIQMITQAIDWAGLSWARLVSLSPFYAHPGELRRAITHAIRAGARQLSGALELLDCRWGARVAGNVGAPVCCSAYGAAVWTAPVLDAARGYVIRARI
jgi:hypothetical protein